MAETQTIDPSKVFVGSRLFKDSNEAGSPIVDESGEWKSGVVRIELLDAKSASVVKTHEIKVTRNKFAAFQEDFATMTKEQVIEEYFTEKAPVESAEAKELAEAKAKIAELEAEKVEAATPDDFFDTTAPVVTTEAKDEVVKAAKTTKKSK